MDPNNNPINNNQNNNNNENNNNDNDKAEAPKLVQLTNTAIRSKRPERGNRYQIGTISTVDSQGRVSHQSPRDFSGSIETLNAFQMARKKGLGSFANFSDLGIEPSEIEQAEPRPSLISTRILETLKNSFVPISNYNYEVGQPSHRWVSEKARQEFLDDVKQMVPKVKAILSAEKTLLHVSDPAYVLGDLHGNYKDLLHFESSIWRLGVKLCPANLVFLGDYVDRGPHSVETVAYIWALKLLNPTKVFLLRGNHETRDVNGDIEGYGKASFRWKCNEICKNDEVGFDLWEMINASFDMLPLAAIIDKHIFCVHGGVPRYLNPDFTTHLAALPRPLDDTAIDQDLDQEHPLVFDMLWSDPATPTEDEQMKNLKLDFAANASRGGDVAIFSTSALEKFLNVTGCSHLIRAHQPKDHGVEIEKAGRVLTVFSSSHYCRIYNTTSKISEDQQNMAACILIVDKKIRIIVLKPVLHFEDQIDFTGPQNFHIDANDEAEKE